MKTAQTIEDLNSRYQERVKRLVEEYDYQRLQPQTFADYMVALNMSYEQERSRIFGD